MITAADAERPPFRLVFGSTAYTSIGKVLTERLRELETQREVALAADIRRGCRPVRRAFRERMDARHTFSPRIPAPTSSLM